MARRGETLEVGGAMVERLDYDTAVRETNRNPMGGLSGSIAAMFSMGAKKATDILKAEYTRITRKAREEEREALRKAILNKAKQQIIKQLQDTEIKKLQALKDQQAREKAAYKQNADSLKARADNLKAQQKEWEAKLAGTTDEGRRATYQRQIESVKQTLLELAKDQRKLDAEENARSARAELEIARQQNTLHEAVQQAVNGINQTYGLQEDIAVNIRDLGISSEVEGIETLETRANTAQREYNAAEISGYAAPVPSRTATRDDNRGNTQASTTRALQHGENGAQRQIPQGNRPQQGTAPVQVAASIDYEKLAEAILHAIREARRDIEQPQLQTTPPAISVTAPESQVIDVVPEPVTPPADDHDESYATLEAKAQANEAQDQQQRQEARQDTQDGLTESFRKQILDKATQQSETLITIQSDLTHIHSAIQDAGLSGGGGGLDLGLGDLLDFKNLFGGGGAGNLISKGKSLVGNAAKGLARFAPWAILAGGAYGGITSATDTDAIMAQKGYTDPSEIELADKIHHGLSGMLSGMSFGLIDTDTIANFTERAGNFLTGDGFVTKKEQKEQLAAQEQATWAEIDAMIAARTQPQGQVQTTDGTYSSDSNSIHSQILQEMGVAPAHNEPKAQELTELNEGMAGVMNSSVSNVTNNNTTNVIPESPRYRISDSTTLALAMQGL